MARRHTLTEAKAVKDDEFYTPRPAVDAELDCHSGAFRGKAVHLPCDDPEWSAFWAAFSDRFGELGLSRLVATHLAPDGETATRTEMEAPGKVSRTALRGRGQFWSPEVSEIMAGADVVATNPPFSLARAFHAQLRRLGKEFLFLGPITAVGTIEVFPALAEGRTRIGHTLRRGGIAFRRPDGTEKRFGSIRWFTSFPVPWPEPMELGCEYDPEEHPDIDGREAIRIDSVRRIPSDYAGTMAVPINIVDHYTPAQFAFAGMPLNPQTDGEEAFKRLLVRNLHATGEPVPERQPELAL